MVGCTAWSDDLELAVQPVSASLARGFVRRHLNAQGLAHLTDDVTLVVSELATNAMAHARTPFTVSLQASEQTLMLKVEDGFRARPVQVDAHVLDTTGRGLTIVALLSRTWGGRRTPRRGQDGMGRVRPVVTSRHQPGGYPCLS